MPRRLNENQNNTCLALSTTKNIGRQGLHVGLFLSGDFRDHFGSFRIDPNHYQSFPIQLGQFRTPP